jgi:hypothetical protein
MGLWPGDLVEKYSTLAVDMRTITNNLGGF